MGRAMIQMASVFGEQERSMLRARVLAGLDRVRQQGKKLGRPKVSPKVENAIRTHLSVGKGKLKVAAIVGCGSGTVQRVKREMVDVGRHSGKSRSGLHDATCGVAKADTGTEFPTTCDLLDKPFCRTLFPPHARSPTKDWRRSTEGSHPGA
jgi:hypothetical protein